MNWQRLFGPRRLLAALLFGALVALGSYFIDDGNAISDIPAVVTPYDSPLGPVG